MAEKKYYWLKLSDGFFYKDKAIKKLRKLAGGDTYTIIFLKMLLKALETDGYLYYDGVDTDFASEVALDIDEDEENVKVAVNFLISVGYLVQCNNDSYMLPHCESMTGSETSSAARVRRYREERKALQCNTDVTECNADVTKCNTEKEKEKEKHKEIKKEKEVYFVDDVLNDAFLDYIEFRKKIKAPLTDRAKQLAINKLKELAGIPFSESMDNDLAVKILEQSIMNGWKGLFPLKDEKRKEASGHSDRVGMWQDIMEGLGDE